MCLCLLTSNHNMCHNMFYVADLEKMSSLERISFLQEKLQDIRNHYLSLKSEVASIDRRRKRMKKKERESESAPCDLRLYRQITVITGRPCSPHLHHSQLIITKHCFCLQARWLLPPPPPRHPPRRPPAH